MTDKPICVDDYREAVQGNGPLACQWRDKPHRLSYDLIGEVERLTAELRSSRAVARMVKECLEYETQTTAAILSALKEATSPPPNAVADGTDDGLWNGERLEAVVEKIVKQPDRQALVNAIAAEGLLD